MGKWRKKSNIESQAVSQPTDRSVVSKDTGRLRLSARWRKHSGRQKLLATMVLLGLIIIGGALVVYWPKPQPKSDDNVKKNQAQLQSLSQKNTYNTGQNKAAETIPELEAYLANPELTIDQRKAALGELATAYMNSGQYDKAIETYNQLSQFEGHETYATASGKAMAYEAMGDKANAITYYQQAVDLGTAEMKTFPKENGDFITYQQQIVTYQEKIKRLQAAP